MAWNPIARREPVTFPLETSGGEASATFAPWSARERLAYEDTLTTRVLADDSAGERTVLMGTMRLVALTLTLVGVEGFPDGFDYRSEADLLSLEADVYGELIRRSLEVQPLPKGPDEEELEADESDDDGPREADPFPTPPTPPGDALAPLEDASP